MKSFVPLLGCYIIGAIPFGLITGKLLKGIDIRNFGSGNIGATNVYRTLGPSPALLVFALDVAKGFLAVLICKSVSSNEWYIISGGLLSVIGHTYSVFLKFAGGRGVATALGVITGLTPHIALFALSIWIVIVAITRYISLASIIAALCVPILMIVWHPTRVPIAYIILASIAALFIVLRHIPNIKRLATGKEPKFAQRIELIQKGGENEK
ncbi:MAG: glycerol-3-phosphate 1-O-acyltransferase PlsY [Armatimonadota bacterium]